MAEENLIAEYVRKEREKALKAFGDASLGNITNTGLTGALYYSKKEYDNLRDLGRDRCFGELTDGRIVEYTEMISLDMLQEAPGDTCPFDDAVFLGMGKFHHWLDWKGLEW